MTRYLFLLMGFTVLITDTVMSSSKSRSIGYIFNADGRLLRIEGINNDYPLLTKESTFYFKIEDNNRTLKARFQPMFNKYLNAYKYLQKKENQSILTYFFGFNDAEFKILNEEYLSNVVFLNEKFKYAKSLKFLGIDNNDSILNYKIESANKFKEEIYDELFTIDILIANRRGPITLTFSDSISLTKNQKQEIIKSTENNIADGFRYELRFTLPESRFIQNNLTTIQKLMPDSNEFNATLKLFNEAVLKLQKIDTALMFQPSCDQYKEIEIEFNAIKSDYYEQIYTYLKSQKEWVKLFLWYTEGVPSLIPLEPDQSKKQDKVDVNKNEEIITGNDTVITYKNIEVLALAEKKNAISSILLANHIGCDACIGHVTDTLYILEKRLNIIKQEIQMRKDQNQKLEKQNREIAASDSAYNVRKKKLQQKDIFLYSGKMIINTGQICSSSGNIYVREHNAENFYKPMNSFKDNYDETAEVMILLENTTKNAKITQIATPIKDVSIFESEAGPAFDELGSFRKNIEALIQKSDSSKPCWLRKNLVDSITRGRVFFQKILKYHKGFEYFQTRSETPSKHTQDTTGSKINSLTSYKINYKIELDKHEYPYEYRVNKLYLFWPTAGFVYSFAKEPEVTINTDGTLSTKYFSGMHLLAGLKIHPWRTSIMDPYFVISGKRRPFFDYRKLYIVLAADVLNITKIYYVGAGIDLWSGLSLTAGSQLIVKKQQKFVNGTVRSKEYLDLRNLYVGINIDLTLAIKMVQFLAFK